MIFRYRDVRKCNRDRQAENGQLHGDIGSKAQTSLLVLYFPQTHDLLKDSAPPATVASHLKQRSDRLSEEGKSIRGELCGFSDLVLTHGFERGRKAL